MGAKDFSTEAKGLPAAGTPDELELSDGEPSSLISERWRSRWKTRQSGCSPITVRFPARP